ncbi:MAG: serine/threonine protein kinase, partial [Patescibacteria group bacterium]|nr:serine/threonine protein kinase [Patescibacteria group bacterium]
GSYLDGEKTQSPWYYHYLEILQGTETMQPMADACRVAVNIPTWMEGRTIYDTLRRYVVQTDRQGNEIDPDLWEVNICVNRKTGTAPDNTVEEIQRLINDINGQRLTQGQKPLHINYIDVEFDPPYNNVGNARKVITDMALMRSMARTGQTQQLYMESEDADLTSSDPHLISNLIHKMDTNPQLDAVQGTQDRMPEVLMQHDYLFVRRRLDDFRKLLLRDKRFRNVNDPSYNFRWNRIYTSGWNMSYTAEAYALIGGYHPLQEMGEDLEIGEKLSIIRGGPGKPNLDIVGSVPTRYDSSPRRFLSELLMQRHAYAPGNFMDEEVNALIKNASLNELLANVQDFARITDANRPQFEKLILGTINWATVMVPKQFREQYIHDLMFWLGFKRGLVKGDGQVVIEPDYAITPKGVRITNWNNIERALHNYRTRHTRDRAEGERSAHHRFNSGEVPAFPTRFTIDELKASTNQIEQGTYVICMDRELGRGYHAKVVAGYDKETGEQFTFKFVDGGYIHQTASNNGFEDRIDAEEHARETVTHPNLLFYMDKFELEGQVVKVYKTGAIDLQTYVVQAGRMNTEQGLQLAVDVVSGLNALHLAGYGHFDLTPGNILLDQTNRAMITDFEGISRRDSSGIAFIRNFREGALEITPPEFLPPVNGTLTDASDVYEVGVLLYYAVMGKYPFTGHGTYREMKQQIREAQQSGRIAMPASIPASLQYVIKRCLAYQPEDRYQSTSDVLEAIQNVQAELAPQILPAAESQVAESPVAITHLMGRAQLSGRPRRGLRFWPRRREQVQPAYQPTN